MPSLVVPDSNFYIGRARLGRDPFSELHSFTDDWEFATCGMVVLEVCRGRRDPNVLRRFQERFSVMLYLATTSSTWERANALAWNLDRRGISLTGSNIADEALDQFLELFRLDQNDYNEQLDFYEVSFSGALRTLKLDAKKKIWRREKRSVPVVVDEETGELPPKIEEAIGLAEAFGAAKLQRAEFRARLTPAIGTLPIFQQRILEMLRLDFPIDSKDPNVMTIAKALGSCEKTIRNQRDQAFNTLKDFLNGDKLP